MVPLMISAASAVSLFPMASTRDTRRIDGTTTRDQGDEPVAPGTAVMRQTAAEMKRARVALFVAAAALVASAGPVAAAPPLHQQFTITDDFSAGASTLVASGAINATGIDVETGSKEAGRTNHSTDDFVFEDGTIHLRVMGVDSSTFDPATCTATVSEGGNFLITGGDGAYAGIRGSGHFTVRGTIQFEQTEDGCNFDSAAGTVTVHAEGTVKL